LRVIAPDWRQTSMKESQVVAELVEEGAGSNKGGADELVPHPERDRHVATEVCNPRRARRHMMILVHGAADGARIAFSETRRLIIRIQTRKRRPGFAPSVGEQHVVEQASAFRIESLALGWAGQPRRQSRLRQFFSSGADRRVSLKLCPQLPEYCSWV